MKNQEKRAFETFVVSEARKADAANFDFTQEIELSTTEQNAISGLPTDFVDLVMAGKLQVDEDCEPRKPDAAFENVDTAELTLNRATDVDEADADKIVDNERKLIERKLKERQESDDPSKNS